ncbi:type II toxin-antitoxin system PrlF family antitoxin (plasmid) [Lactiplantibacillus plantarum]
MSAGNVTKVSSKITSKNQITIPKTVRELLKVRSTDTIEWQIEPNGKVMIVRSKPDLWQLVDEQEKSLEISVQQKLIGVKMWKAKTLINEIKTRRYFMD